jgi:hypothetical protein
MSNNKNAPKKTYKKSPYGNAKHFTNTELLSIITKYQNDKTKDKKSWMSFDLKNETKNEKMEKNKVRYLQILVTDLDGKDRPLVRDLAPTITESKCKLGETDDGKIPSSASFSVGIKIMCEPGDEITVDRARELLAPADDDEWVELQTKHKIGKKFHFEKYKVTPEFIDNVISVMSEVIVSEKFADISQDQYEATVKRQDELLRQQYNGWRVDKAISLEFERLLNDKAGRKAIGWNMGEKQSVAGNVQTTRKPREDADGSMDKDDEKLLEKLSEETGKDIKVIPLDNWRVYYRIRISTVDGTLWCKVYDVTTPVPKGQPRKLATLKNPDTGKVELLTYKTIESWLRYGSAFTGPCKYQLCISAMAGARLHAAIGPEMAARRGAKGEGKSQLEDGVVDELGDFGGNFDAGGDDSDEESEDKPAKAPAKKTGQLTALEQQMKALDAAADDDE